MQFLMTVLLSAVLGAPEKPAEIAPPNQREEQRQAVEAIQKLGGKVLYDYQRPDPNQPNLYDPEALPKNPDAFHPVVFVDLSDTQTTDEDLKVLAKLPALENLSLSRTQITGRGLAHLKDLKKMRCLGLWKTRVDDAGLKHLKGMTRMWILVLDETQVTDAGLVHLKDMTGLQEWLGLTHTQITDDGLKHLEGFTKLKSLNLRLTPVTEAGAQKLRNVLPDTDISFGP
jgi:hypothetical protein